MKTIVHFPKTGAAVKELQKAVAKVHAEAVIAKISSLKLPRDRQELLVDAIIKAVSTTGDGA